MRYFLRTKSMKRIILLLAVIISFASCTILKDVMEIEKESIMIDNRSIYAIVQVFIFDAETNLLAGTYSGVFGGLQEKKLAGRFELFLLDPGTYNVTVTDRAGFTETLAGVVLSPKCQVTLVYGGKDAPEDSLLYDINQVGDRKSLE